MQQPDIQPTGTPQPVPPEITPSKPDSGLWSGWLTFALGIAVFAVFAIAQTVVAMVYILPKLFSGALPDTFDDIMNLALNGDLISYATIASAIFGIGLIILFIKIHKGAGIREYLGLKAISGKTYLALLGIVILMVALTVVVEMVFNLSEDTDSTTNMLVTATYPALLWVAVVIFAPLFEEIFFRGFLLVGFKQTRMRAAGAVAVTAIGWAALHFYGWFGIISILIMGIVFGIVRIKTKSLWSTIFMHSLWNFIALLMATLSVNGIIK